MEKDGTLAVISNIPPSFHSKDLRRYFSTFVENGRFDCFHYRHRPIKPNDPSSSDLKSKSIRCCCLVRISGTKQDRCEFIRTYHGKNWTNENGDTLPFLCHISPARLADDEPFPLELKPPTGMMPQGNVGTPSDYFLGAINECRLPSSLIAKLGLASMRRNVRRIYSSVPPPACKTTKQRSGDHHFGDNGISSHDSDDEETADEPAEEWDRHEAQYDDVTDQERTKERLYEEDLEVVWEKGGPGLVFYTDSYYWDQQETDTDAKWADDWDVDTNVYLDPVDADKDARDSVAIRRESMLKSGQYSESVFKKAPLQSLSRTRKRRREQVHDDSGNDGPSVSDFALRTMERHGWKPGTGLGSASSGKVHPVHDEMQEFSRMGFDKRGIGYYGEKLNRNVVKKVPKHLITTIYDNPIRTDPPEQLLTRQELVWNKHR